MYASNSRPSKYMKQIVKIFKEEIESSTIITEDFITPLSIRKQGKKLRIQHNRPTRSNRTLYSTAAASMFSSSIHGIFSRVD